MLAVILTILVILARRWDLKDLRKISVVPMCGKDGPFKYEVTVTTGRRQGAGKVLCVKVLHFNNNNNNDTGKNSIDNDNSDDNGLLVTVFQTSSSLKQCLLAASLCCLDAPVSVW